MYQSIDARFANIWILRVNNDVPMKKIFVLLVLCSVSLTVSAQSRMSYSLEFEAGVGFWKGPLATFAPEFVAQYDLGGNFIVGAGAGARYAMPCLQYITKNGSRSRSFFREVDIPVFLRIGYGKEQFFANLDAGYAIGVLGYYGAGWEPGGKKDRCYDGLFVQPQVGWRVGRRSALALGLLLQKSTVSNHVTTENGDYPSPSYSITTEVHTEDVYSPALTLRYILSF